MLNSSKKLFQVQLKIAAKNHISSKLSASKKICIQSIFYVTEIWQHFSPAS